VGYDKFLFHKRYGALYPGNINPLTCITGERNETNDVCVREIVFNNSVVNTCIGTLLYSLPTTCAYLWCVQLLRFGTKLWFRNTKELAF